MSGATAGQCSGCRYWNGDRPAYDRGEFFPGHCHRYPPDAAAGWPHTEADDFCGEFVALKPTRRPQRNAVPNY